MKAKILLIIITSLFYTLFYANNASELAGFNTFTDHAVSDTLKNGSGDHSPFGTWLSANGKEKIEIYEVDGRICGRIVWMKEAFDEEGQLKIDSKNPDESLRSRPLVGMEILFDFKYSGNGCYTGGKIYDPISGNIYTARIKMKNETTVKVRGYVGIPLFGRSEICTKIIK